MRILTIASEVPPVTSGVSRSVGHIIDGVRQAGHDVEALSYADSRVLVRDRLRLSTLALELRASTWSQFDLLHLHGPCPSVSDLLLLRRRMGQLGIPFVYTHHFTLAGESDALGKIYDLYDRGARWLAQGADAIVTTSQSYADLVRSPRGPDVRVIPWAGELEPGPARTVTDPTDPLRVLVVGQMRRYKGHQVALDAVRGQTDIELTLVGGGPLADHLRAQADQESNIHFEQSPTDERLGDLYRRSDIIALPATNRLEAFGIVLVEAMTQGCVPVASDLPGVRDVAGPTGRLCPPGDHLALRKVLVELGSDRHDLLRRAHESTAQSRTYSWERTVQAHLDLYEELWTTS